MSDIECLKNRLSSMLCQADLESPMGKLGLQVLIAQILCCVAENTDSSSSSNATVDIEVVCASTDRRPLAYNTGDQTLTELDGSPITDGAVAGPCDVEYKTVSACFRDSTDPSVEYTRILCFEVGNPASLSTLWIDNSGSLVPEPANIERCDGDQSELLQEILSEVSILEQLLERSVREIECQRKTFSVEQSLIDTDNVIDATASPIDTPINLFPNEGGLVDEISIRILNNGSDPAGIPFTLDVDGTQYTFDQSSVASGPLGPLAGNIPPGRYDVVFPISPPIQLTAGQQVVLTRVEGAEPLVFWTSNTNSDDNQVEFDPPVAGEYPQLTVSLDEPDALYQQCFYNDGTNKIFDCFNDEIETLPSNATSVCRTVEDGSSCCKNSCCDGCDGEIPLTCPRDVVLNGEGVWIAPAAMVSYSITSFTGAVGTYTNGQGDVVPLLPDPNLSLYNYAHERDSNTLLIKQGVRVDTSAGGIVQISWNELCEGED